MADCLGLLSHGGVLQRGQLFVLVCIVLLNPGVMYSTDTISRQYTGSCELHAFRKRLYIWSASNNIGY
jgi:hypothetical protein